ncbi:MAG TPA: hypothetical protein VJT33_02275 [bacterium]|nr:hypothetical protein [bacterium]
MGWFDQFRGRAGSRSRQLVARIADDPQMITQNGTTYMVFHLEEAPGKEFRLRMLPTTPKRRHGDRVALTYSEDGGGIAKVEAMTAAPDAEATRRRNAEYLASIEANEHGQK